MTCLGQRVLDQFAVIAHRGASGYAPENTVAAFELAIDLGATAIELDVQMTRDGHLIVWHDDTIDRTSKAPESGGEVFVRDLTLDQLRAYDVGRWFNEGFPLLACSLYEELSPITLVEALDTFGRRLPLLIEPKGLERSNRMVEELVRCLRTPTGLNRHALLSHDMRCLNAVRSACPHVTPILLIDSGSACAGGLGINSTARVPSSISPHKDVVDAKLVAQAHWHDIAVYPHTVNHPGEIRRLVDMGVDGVITDLPDQALAVLERIDPGIAGSHSRSA